MHCGPHALKCMLFGWTASGTARQLTQELPVPPAALDPTRAKCALQTRKAHLDAGASASRAGRRLYRHLPIRHMYGVLDMDLDDPDQRFALELACRGHLTSRVGGPGRP
jgi:hypothetical protein